MLKVKDLTNGERLLILRRRADLTKVQCAENHEVSLYRYSRWESDEDSGPKLAVSRLKLHEASYLMRLRDGTSAKDFAAILSVSPWWLRQMEAGVVSSHRMEKHWERCAKNKA